MPDDIAREKQRELGRQLATAETQRAKLLLTSAGYKTGLAHATELAAHCDDAYRRAGEPLRRDFNQAWFDKLKFRSDDGATILGTVRRTEWAEALHTARSQTVGQGALVAAPAEPNFFGQILENGMEGNGQKERPDTLRYRVISFVGGSKVACLVELLGRYSKLTLPLKLSQIIRLLASKPRPGPSSSGSAPRIHNASRRLGPDAVQQLVADYQAGIPSTQLMKTYELGKGTVLRLLRQHGVQFRNQPMNPNQINQAIRLYETGHSLAAVGRQLGFDHTVICNALERTGIPRRDSHGRPR